MPIPSWRNLGTPASPTTTPTDRGPDAREPAPGRGLGGRPGGRPSGYQL